MHWLRLPTVEFPPLSAWGVTWFPAIHHKRRIAKGMSASPKSIGHPRRQSVYRTSPLKRSRRTRDQIQSVLNAIKTILDGEEGQITIRHLFYRLVGLGVIPKTEGAYKGLCGHLSKWRRTGEVQWSAFADSTRWHLRRETFDSVDEALASTVATYRRNLWTSQPCYVECWCEKDAVASILYRAAVTFGVPVFVARGFASLSSLYDAANTFRAWSDAGKKPIIYHFGDWDPSGVAAGDSMLSTIQNDFNVEIEFVRAAVTPAQIEAMNLPTRPVKTSDTRAAKWTGGECVELDCMPPAEIRSLVTDCITRHIDQREWEALQQTEEMERETLASIRDQFRTPRRRPSSPDPMNP